ncbi:MAG TPA: hypothetical protein EYG86_05545, partial [Crocinitomicaceae bacterium]|nr:hypothetical protein [Crocinitomicaceae bacterium]
MKIIHRILLIVVTFGSTISFSQIQCVVDVAINEGATISMCSNALTTISGSNGYVSYAWSGPEVLTGQTITPQFSGTYTLAATDAVNCISTVSIIVTINAAPTPTIISSEGNVICPSIGTTLSTTIPYSTYDWGSGNTGAT